MYVLTLCACVCVCVQWIGVSKKRAYTRRMEELTLVRALEADVSSNKRPSVVGRYKKATNTIQSAIKCVPRVCALPHLARM